MTTWLENLYLREWLRTLGWAAGVALAIYVVGALGSSAKSRAAASAVAVALGFAAAHCTVAGIPDLPPEIWQWSVWFTLASLLLLFLEEARGGQAVLRLLLQLLLIGALEWFVLRPSPIAREWTTRQWWIGFFGGGIAVTLFVLLAEHFVTKSPPWRVGIAATIAATGAAVVYMVLHASEKIARTEAGLAAALGVCTLIALVQRDVPIGRTVVTTATIAFGSLLLYTWSVQAVPDPIALLLFGSWASVILPLPKSRPWTTLVVSIVLAAAPAAYAWYLTRGPVP
jgi:hypothetical protein